VEHVQFTVEQLPLEAVLPSTQSGEPQLQGKLTMNVQGRLPTLDPTALVNAMSGSGHLKLADPRVANLNVLRAVFEKLAMLPGLMETLEARLPKEYQAKLAARDTILSPLDISVQLEDGALQFEELRVSADTFRLDGSGTVRLDGTVAIRSVLRIEPGLSAAIIKSVNELQALSNQGGELEIPLMIQGQAPQVAVLPDLNYVASKVLVTKVQDLLGNFLQKALEKERPSDEPSAP